VNRVNGLVLRVSLRTDHSDDVSGYSRASWIGSDLQSDGKGSKRFSDSRFAPDLRPDHERSYVQAVRTIGPVKLDTWSEHYGKFDPLLPRVNQTDVSKSLIM
jgi:hypothetical protein